MCEGVTPTLDAGVVTYVAQGLPGTSPRAPLDCFLNATSEALPLNPRGLDR
jgi:hypothetical protein